MGPDDVQLHIQSEHGTGGHWCAKVFFFSLLMVLLGLICLILMENRGLADRKCLNGIRFPSNRVTLRLFSIVDTPLSESRFADMLEGWVDEERQPHDDHEEHKLPEEHDSNEHDDHEDDDDIEDHDHDDQDDDDDDEPDKEENENDSHEADNEKDEVRQI